MTVKSPIAMIIFTADSSLTVTLLFLLPALGRFLFPVPAHNTIDCNFNHMNEMESKVRLRNIEIFLERSAFALVTYS